MTLRPAPTGLSMAGDVQLFAVQWHIQDDTRTYSQIKREAIYDLPNVLRRHRVDQVSQPRFAVVENDGESFLEALLDVRPWRRSESGGSTP